jgi:flavodoxin
MNSLVAYYSEFGNTARIAEAIGATLEAAGPTCVVDLKRLRVSELRQLDLLVVGVPTHRMNVPEVARALLRAIPRRTLTKGTAIAAFDTSYDVSRWLRRFTASHKLLSRLRRLGGRRVIPPETFLVTGKEGPLYEGEIDRARTWASEILARLGQRQSGIHA